MLDIRLRHKELGYLSEEQVKHMVGGEELLSALIQGPMWLLEGLLVETFPDVEICCEQSDFPGRDWDSESRQRITDR